MADPPREPPHNPTTAAFSSPIPHVAELGIELIEAGGGRGIMRLPWRENLVGNPETGVLHGGVVTTLIDSICGLACLTALDEPQPIVTLDLRIDYLRPATPKLDIFAAAETYKVTRQVVFTRATAYQEGPDDLVAASVGTFMLSGRLGIRTTNENVAGGDKS
jgi:uncharacterized protein (TIGR00369 family)